MPWAPRISPVLRTQVGHCSLLNVSLQRIGYFPIQTNGTAAAQGDIWILSAHPLCLTQLPSIRVRSSHLLLPCLYLSEVPRALLLSPELHVHCDHPFPLPHHHLLFYFCCGKCPPFPPRCSPRGVAAEKRNAWERMHRKGGKVILKRAGRVSQGSTPPLHCFHVFPALPEYSSPDCRCLSPPCQ